MTLTTCLATVVGGGAVVHRDGDRVRVLGSASLGDRVRVTVVGGGVVHLGGGALDNSALY